MNKEQKKIIEISHEFSTEIAKLFHDRIDAYAEKYGVTLHLAGIAMVHGGYTGSFACAHGLNTPPEIALVQGISCINECYEMAQGIKRDA